MRGFLNGGERLYYHTEAQSLHRPGTYILETNNPKLHLASVRFAVLRVAAAGLESTLGWKGTYFFEKSVTVTGFRHCDGFLKLLCPSPAERALRVLQGSVDCASDVIRPLAPNLNPKPSTLNPQP